MKKIHAEYVASSESAIPDEDFINELLDEWCVRERLQLSESAFNSLADVVRTASDKIATEKNIDFVRQFADLCARDLGGVIILKALGMDARELSAIARTFGVSRQAVHKRVSRLREIFKLPDDADGESVDQVDFFKVLSTSTASRGQSRVGRFCEN